MWTFLKNVIFTICVPGSVTVWIPWLWLRAWHRGTMISSLLAAPLIVVGVSLLLICIWDFGTSGEGTPFPLDPPRNLVRGRLYKATRNPMYIGVVLILLGEAVGFESRFLLEYSVVVAIGFHLFVLVVEEPSLRHKFGESYAAYCVATPRWLPLRGSHRRSHASAAR